MYPTRYCGTHGTKMTLLFNDYVCDVCRPPKSAKGGIQCADPLVGFEEIVWRIPWTKLGFGGANPVVMFRDSFNTHQTLAYAADLILSVRSHDTVEVLKNRWFTPVSYTVEPHVWHDLRSIGQSCFRNPITGEGEALFLIYVRDRR